MEKGARSLSYAWLVSFALFSALGYLPYSAYAAGSSTTVPQGLLIADLGGPYSGVVGEEITFDGSQSRDARNIEFYRWDFGDGEKGTGRITTHRYMQAGFYNASLTVVGYGGEKSIDRTGVYIRNLDLSVEAIISPSQPKYEYGDSIKSIDAIVRYPNKTGVLNASVSGTLIGNKHVDLRFVEKGNGIYRAEQLYPFLKGEAAYVTLSINAVDSYGNRGTHSGKIIVSPSDQELSLRIEQPTDKVFAYGQIIQFKAWLLSNRDRPIQNGYITLVEGWSRKNYSLTKKEDGYYFRYEVPRDAKDEIAFVLVAGGVIDGKAYDTGEILDFAISSKLNVAFVEPKLGEYSSNISRIVLNVTYPNGEPIRGERIKAVINGDPAILNRKESVYVVNRTIKSADRTIKVTVEDAMGNSGSSEIRIIPEETSPLINPSTLAFALIGLLVVSISAALALRYHYARRRKEDLKREYEELKQQREALKKLMKTIMHEYYTRKITSDDAKKRMLDYEKELLIEREKMRSVLHKLGIKMETEGKEELIEWIVEKLDQGEDPELLKEGLADTGIDPKIVDDIKKNLI